MSGKSQTDTNARHRHGLNAFNMTVENGIIHISMKIEGIEKSNYMLDVKGNTLKIGVIRKKNGRVIGVFNEHVFLPNAPNARLIEHHLKGELLNIRIAQNHFFLPQTPPLARSPLLQQG